MPGAAPDELPSSIGRYQIVARMLSDETDDLYQGFDPLIERPVIVKVFRLRTESAPAQTAIKQIFYREVQRTGVLVHHGIATLFDAGELTESVFVAREFVEGTTLAGLLGRRTGIDLAVRVSLLLQIVDALEYARDLGVAHLNLKPTNVLVTTDSLLKLTGFGEAALLDALAAASAIVPPASAYIAPERARGEAGDYRSDVYSLGRIALDVLGGGAAQAPLPPDLAERGVAPERWSAMFARALALDPAQRFASVGALKVELLMALSIAEVEARLAWESSRTLGTAASAEPDAETLPPSPGSELFDDATTMIVNRRG